MRWSVRGIRRAVAVLVLLAAALLTLHLADPNAPAMPAAATDGRPAIYVVMRGQVASVSPSSLTVTAENQQGQPTGVKHTVALDSTTRVIWPSAAVGGPTASGRTLKPGLRVLVRAHGTVHGGFVADTVRVSYPPLDGTLVALSGHRLTIRVPGQADPVAVLVTSRTAFYVPGGQWSALKAGAPLRIFVRPAAGTPAWQATSVVVGPSSGGR